MVGRKDGKVAPRVAARPRWCLLRNRVVVLVSAIVLGCLLSPCFADEAPAADPSGTATGDKNSTTDAAGNAFVVTAPTDPTAPDYRRRRKTTTTIRRSSPRNLWRQSWQITSATSGSLQISRGRLLTGYLVLFMQAGFALLTCGLVRKKNAGHLMMLNFAAYVFAFLAYYAVGYAFQFGAVAVNAAPVNLGGTPTLNHFLLGSGTMGISWRQGLLPSGPGYDAGSLCLTLFEVVFMETAGYIIVGAICERITFWSFLLVRALHGRDSLSHLRLLGLGWRLAISGGGDAESRSRLCRFRRLNRGSRGGGFAAMALAVILGPRLGKYGPDGKVKVFPAHNLAFVVTGTFILLFGWMGFNPGSTLGASDLRISVIAVNTNLAAVAGSAVALLLWYMMFGKPDITMACNGMLAGLGRHHGPCAFVSPNSAVVIGILAGVVVCLGVLFNDRVARSTILAEQSRCMATAAGWGRFVSVSSPTAPMVLAGTA